MTEKLPVGSGFAVLDSNSNMCNIVPKPLFKKMLNSVCSKLIEVMGEHCGPNSEFAIIDDPFTSIDKPEFSKDGIDIINTIRFVNRIEDSIRRLLSYCASNSDRIAGDGTTSAMIITIATLKSLNEMIMVDENESNVKVTYRKLVDRFDSFCEQYLNSSVGNYKVSDIVEQITDELGISDQKEIDILKKAVVYCIAYSQAFTSSHGDHELAKAVAILFSNTPEDCWEHVFFRKSIFENEDRFKVEYIKDQFLTTARIMSKSMLNAKLGGKLSYKNATLIAMPHPILYSQYGQFMKLKDAIEDHVINKKELLIVHTNVLDQQTQQAIYSIFEHLKDDGHINETVAILHHEPIEENLNDITVLNFICGLMPTLVTEDFNIVHNVQVEFDQFHLRLNGLYKNPDDSDINPYFYDKSFPEFRDALDVIEESIANYKSSGPSYTKRDNIMNYNELFHKMKYTKRVTIDIGGMIHHSTSAVAVVKDCVYATRSSLLKGFELGGAMGMYNKCESIGKEHSDWVGRFAQAFCDGVNSLHGYIYDKTNLVEHISGDDGSHKSILSTYDEISRVDKIWDINSDSFKTATEFVSHIKKVYLAKEEGHKIELEDFTDIGQEHVSVIQPRAINDTIVKRFGDLYLRVLNSSKIIGVGGVVVPDTETE